ncbi:MAG: histidine phosphatase family protein [Armatimonadota bacterium]|jgi:broad specificity phosphatase PhoE
MTRVLLIRHGQTEWNRKQVVRGRADIPLSSVGIEQAMAVAERLAHEPISAVYSSPLARALVTAEHVARRHGLQPCRVEGLTDISFGAWEGRSHEDVKREDGELYVRWQSQPHLVRLPDGETLAEVRQRVMAALNDIVTRHTGSTVAVVAHRAANKVLLCAFLGLGDDAFWRIRQDTGCVNELEWEGGQFVVALMNDTCHLRGLERDALDF